MYSTAELLMLFLQSLRNSGVSFHNDNLTLIALMRDAFEESIATLNAQGFTTSALDMEALDAALAQILTEEGGV